MKNFILTLLATGLLQAQFTWREFKIYPPPGEPVFTLKLPDDYKKVNFELNYPPEAFSEAFIEMDYELVNCDVPLKMGIAFNGEFLGFKDVKLNGSKIVQQIPVYLLKRFSTLEVSISLKSLKTHCLGYINIKKLLLKGLINYLQSPYLISQYPDILLNKEKNPDNVILFQLPEKISPVTSMAVSYIAEDLGYRGKSHTPEIEVIRDAGTARKGVTLIIGTPEEQYFSPLMLKIIGISSHISLRRGRGHYFWVNAKGEKIPEDLGVLITTNNAHGFPVFIVTGNSDEAVLKAALALITEARGLGENVFFVASEYYGFNRTPVILGPEPEYFDLSQVYKGTARVTGPEARFVLPLRFLPGMEFLPYSQIFRLRLKASRFVNIKKSKLKITIDGEKILDENMVGPCADSGKEVVIPWKALEPVNFLNFDFKIVPRIPVTDSSLLWVEILPTTRFRMTRKWVIEMPDLKYLKYYGFPFGYSPYVKKTYAVIDQLSTDRFKVYLEFMRFLGEKEVFPEIPIIGQVGNLKKFRHNVVFIGNYQKKGKQPFLYEDLGKYNNAYLYISFKNEEEAGGIVKLFRFPAKLNAIYGNLANIDYSGEVVECRLTRRISYWGAPEKKFDMRYFFLENYYKLLIYIPLILIILFLALTALRYLVRGLKLTVRSLKRHEEPEKKFKRALKVVSQNTMEMESPEETEGPSRRKTLRKKKK